MIDVENSIYNTLIYKLHKLTKLGLLDPIGFKGIMLAVILNDMKEWLEYIPDIEFEKFSKIVTDYLMDNGFEISTKLEDFSSYKNTNTPLDNTTWSRIWDNKNAKVISNVCSSIERGTIVRVPNCILIEDGVLTFDSCSNGTVVLGS